VDPYSPLFKEMAHDHARPWELFGEDKEAHLGPGAAGGANATTIFPSSPRLLKGGLKLLNLDNCTAQQIIALQYKPDSLRRSLGGTETRNHVEVFHLAALLAETPTWSETEAI